MLNNANAVSMGTNNFKKWNITTLNSAHQAKKQCNFDKRLVRTTAGWFTSLLMNLVNLRDLLGVETKSKESILKKPNQIKSTFTSRTWVLSTEWTRAWPIQHHKCLKGF